MATVRVCYFFPIQFSTSYSLLAFYELEYFILWDEQIMEYLLHPKDDLGKKALNDLTKLEKAKSNSSVDKTSKLNKKYRDNWLALAQKDMIDVKKFRLSSALVGKLYSLCRASSARDSGQWDIYNEDAIAFAKAYKDSLVRCYIY